LFRPMLNVVPKVLEELRCPAGVPLLVLAVEPIVLVVGFKNLGSAAPFGRGAVAETVAILNLAVFFTVGAVESFGSVFLVILIVDFQPYGATGVELAMWALLHAIAIGCFRGLGASLRKLSFEAVDRR